MCKYRAQRCLLFKYGGRERERGREKESGRERRERLGGREREREGGGEREGGSTLIYLFYCISRTIFICKTCIIMCIIALDNPSHFNNFNSQNAFFLTSNSLTCIRF